MNSCCPASSIPGRLQRFESLAYGMFVHWGLYSIYGRGEWLWQHHKISCEVYLRAFEKFSAVGFDARAFVRRAKEFGFRYICLTTLHHEGFSLYDTCGLNEFDATAHPYGEQRVIRVARLTPA